MGAGVQGHRGPISTGTKPPAPAIAGATARGVAATCSVRDGVNGSANLSALTNFQTRNTFDLLSWSNTRGIRLLNGTMQVEILPAAPVFAADWKRYPAERALVIELPDSQARCRLRRGQPLPGGVKVARRPVKPRGVGASPTLAAIFNLRFTNDDLQIEDHARAPSQS